MNSHTKLNKTMTNELAQNQVCVVGSCISDLIAYVSRFPDKGETMHANDFQRGFGGKGANQAVMAARLGSSTAMVGRVGRDADGTATIHNLEHRHHHINVQHIIPDDTAPTGTAMITVSSTGDNTIVIAAGANLHVTRTDIDRAWSSGVISSSSVVVCQNEISLDATQHTLQRIRDELPGTWSIFNPAPVSEDLLQHGDELLSAAKMFVPNETEAGAVLGRRLVPGDIEGAKEAAKELRRRGCENVVITLGSEGCVVLAAEDGGERGEGTGAAQDTDDVVHIPAPRLTHVVDTTGAGDAFVGAMSHMLARGRSVRDAARYGVQIAAISVQGHGTQTSFPWEKDLPTELRIEDEQ